LAWELGDREPVRLKIALRSLDGAPFCYCFALGQSSRLVMLTVEQDRAEDEGSVKEHGKELNAAQSIFPEEPRSLAGEIKDKKTNAPAATRASTKRTTMGNSKPGGCSL
jgi:translation initiation factor 4A